MSDDKLPEHQHDFDGIEELDNDLPRWWLSIFWVSFLFAGFYVPYYHFMHPEKLPRAAHAAEVAAIEAVRASKGTLDEAGLQKLYAAGGWNEGAMADYKTLCAACHLADGGGSIGPNFTDDYYLHGGTLTEIVHVITEGVPAKGMVPWKSQLKPEQIQALAFYIKDFRGQTSATPKAAQGLRVDDSGRTIEGATAPAPDAAPAPAPAADTAVADTPAQSKAGPKTENLLQDRYKAGGWQESAQKDYNMLCVACHLNDGGGSVGPNFTDDYYLHGGKLTDMVHVITEGVPAKGMIPWKSQLKPEQIENLAFLIRDMRGTTPATPKDPQGKKVDQAGNFVE